jgi:hypothetical protein
MKSYRMTGLVVVASLVCLVGTVRADVVNGSFSAGDASWNTQGAWTADTASPDGASIKGTGYAWLYQTDVATPAMVAGQTYQMSFLGKLLVDDGNAGDAMVKAVVGVQGATSSGDHFIAPTLTSTWQEYSLTFTAVAADVGNACTVAFLNSYGKVQGMEGSTGGSTLGIDNVRFAAVSTPEPSTLVLLGAGLLGLLAYAWRKRS